MEEIIISGDGKDKKNEQKTPLEFGGLVRISDKFAALNKLILRDLNNNKYTPSFSLYTKDDITRYLSNPYRYEKQLRDAVIYIYGASSHFRRLVQYFVSLSDLAYIVEPYKIDPKKANVKTTNLNYRRVLNMLSSMNIKTQVPKILKTCLKEDTFYGTFWITDDSITIQQLPSDYCSISTIEGNVLNVTFDFSYFDSHGEVLQYYPDEFQKLYAEYQNQKTVKWRELSSPNTFAIKCNNDILSYSIPPFVGVLREIYDIEDYKQLKKTRTALENYAMLVMKLPVTPEGEWGIDYKKAEEFWSNLDGVLPEEVGTVLSPMAIEKISFERNNNTDGDTIVEAEQSMFTAAGVSSLLFNNEKASSNALLLSIKADQAITYEIVKSVGDAINRLIQSQPYWKNFKVNFLDVSPWNRKEAGDLYLKAASYGLPTISMYAASQGLGQAELDAMSFLEGKVLQLQDLFTPIQSSTQMSGGSLESKGATDSGGAPKKDAGEITDSGEQSSEQHEDWG